jgi:2',3'-cyclic-nucleotide 2'-phosphodiesterase (5'-nucleotidase family)
MKKCATIFLFLLIFLNIIFIHDAVNAAQGKTEPPAAANTISERELLILFTHDLHSYFLPHKTVTDEGTSVQQGGYAKLACVINEQRNLHKNKSILVDAGDFSMGTLFHTLFMTEALELRLMGKMGYEVTTLGNHDFDFHPYGLARMLTSAMTKGERIPAIVASNVVLSKNDPGDAMLKKPFTDYPIREYVVIERNGLRIGLFGIIGQDAVHDTPFARPVTFSDATEASKRMVDILKNREKVDIIICLSHSGTSTNKRKSEDENLAKAVPQIDIIISGHTHTVLPEPIIIGKTIIVASGSYGRYLGMLGIRYDNQGSVKLATYELKHISADVCENKEIASNILTYKNIVNRGFLAPYHLTYDEVIAESHFHMESLDSATSRPREMGLGNLITDAYRAAIKQAEGNEYRHVHFALQPLGHIRDSFQEGKITAADIFQVLSLGIGPDEIPGYPLVSFYVSGKELKDILEVHTTIAPLKKHDAYLQVSGVKFTYNPRRVWFDRVTSVEVEDEHGTFQPLDKNKFYRGCVNMYTAAMIDYVSFASHGLIKVQPKDQSGNKLSDLKSAIVYMKSEELKEWLALTLYLHSFKKADGSKLPRIPEKYSKPEGRYLSQPSLNPVNLIYGGNIVTCVVLTTALCFLLICALTTYIVIRKIRKKVP